MSFPAGEAAPRTWQAQLGFSPPHSLHPSRPEAGAVSLTAPLLLLPRARGHLSTKWWHCCPHGTLMTPQGGPSPFDFLILAHCELSAQLKMKSSSDTDSLQRFPRVQMQFPSSFPILLWQSEGGNTEGSISSAGRRIRFSVPGVLLVQFLPQCADLKDIQINSKFR